jgi:5-methylcytosine-specific restriction endonuclease McrA
MPRLTTCATCSGYHRPGERCPKRGPSPYRQAPHRRAAAAAKRRSSACEFCAGRRLLTAHHVIPREQGGPDHPDNYVVLCGSCHTTAEHDLRARRTTQLTMFLARREQQARERFDMPGAAAAEARRPQQAAVLLRPARP